MFSYNEEQLNSDLAQLAHCLQQHLHDKSEAKKEIEQETILKETCHLNSIINEKYKDLVKLTKIFLEIDRNYESIKEHYSKFAMKEEMTNEDLSLLKQKFLFFVKNVMQYSQSIADQNKLVNNKCVEIEKLCDSLLLNLNLLQKSGLSGLPNNKINVLKEQVTTVKTKIKKMTEDTTAHIVAAITKIKKTLEIGPKKIIQPESKDDKNTDKKSSNNQQAMFLPKQDIPEAKASVSQHYPQPKSR